MASIQSHINVMEVINIVKVATEVAPTCNITRRKNKKSANSWKLSGLTIISEFM